MHYMVLVGMLMLGSCKGQFNEKINGLSFVSSGDRATQGHVDAVLDMHANSAAIMPFGFMSGIENPNLQYNAAGQWFGETLTGVKQYIDILKKNNIQVMLKPQIWVRNGVFTGNIKMKTAADWAVFEKAYSNFILDYAKVAEETKTAVFCIGTELALFIKHRPTYWLSLIKSLRAVYSGKLTYAANWDEYTKTPFWNTLDYIGIDAYFPLSEAKTPAVISLSKAWVKHKNAMKGISNTYKRPILFTEFGYRSVDYTGSKPWEVDYSKTSVNLVGQANAIEAILDTFWEEEWFAGGYVWKWFMHHEQAGGMQDARFTPQNKPAERVIKEFFSH
jgi:hypothetical protein